MKRTGAQVVWECLVREGVDTVFGYPGGAILPTYDAMLDYPVHHVLVRHEQGASHMADGYARASGKVGVAIGTSGPGATNMVTGIATAMLDSSPIVCITGQVGSKLIGTDGFQEVDVTGVTLPITKHNYLVTRAEDVARTFREAFYIAKSGRPGPVLIDVPKDVASETIKFSYPEARLGFTGGLIAGLAARIPHKIAMEFMLLGESLDAARAYQVGFVNRVVPNGRHVEAALEMAAAVADSAPMVVR